MNSEEIIKAIQRRTNFGVEKIRPVLNSFRDTIGSELKTGRIVEIPGFDQFAIVSYSGESTKNLSKQSDDKLKSAAAQKSNIEISTNSYTPYVDLSKTTIPKKTLAFIPEHVARHYQVVPIAEKDNKLIVAMIDPEDREAIEFVRKKTGQELDLRICTQADLNHILDQYSGVSGELKKIVESVSEDEVAEPNKKEDAQTKIKEEEIVASAPAAKIIQSLINRAVREGASDIHIEPTEEEIVVRFRLDGVLQKIITLPLEILASIVSRIKILSGMKIDETRLPQDGRFQITLDQAEVDFRVATFPTVNGEKVVMRILDKSAGILSLEQLGLRGTAFSKIEANIRRPHGMILVTGPTGSGKTTTLYAVLQKLMSTTVNIVTLEDPVEYRIPTINQAQVKAEIGFTFANGLRSILRQDPNVIMIGEIRDYETADMAVHSALTGHIVLSTLHTNNAAGAVPRLIDMKIEPFLINSSVNAIVAQRLCRRICEDCREPFQVDPANLAEAEREIKALPAQEKQPGKIQFFHGKGCSTCSNTGYKGRVGIYEIFELTDDLKILVAKRASGTELAAQAVKNGMVTMRQDGILKAVDGITTLDEVWRVSEE